MCTKIGIRKGITLLLQFKQLRKNSAKIYLTHIILHLYIFVLTDLVRVPDT